MKLSKIINIAADVFLAKNQSEKVHNQRFKARSVMTSVATAISFIKQIDGYKAVRTEEYARILAGFQELGFQEFAFEQIPVKLKQMAINEKVQSDRYAFMKFAQLLAEEQDV